MLVILSQSVEDNQVRTYLVRYTSNYRIEKLAHSRVKQIGHLFQIDNLFKTELLSATKTNS